MKSAIELTKALADQTRLDILHRLAEGPANVSEIVAAVNCSQSKISNHLQVLRESGLVENTRHGRKQTYSLADSNVLVLLESLAALSRPHTSAGRDSNLAQARTCYDHLAGKAGVAMFQSLQACQAIRVDAANPAVVSLGEHGEAFFHNLGVDLRKVTRARRRFATACLDWTEKERHLGGSLGAALCDRLIQLGYVVRQPGTRAVTVTRKGQAAIARW